MKLFLYEILKLIKRKSFWILVVTMLLLDSFLIFMVKNIEDPENNISMYHASIQEEMRGMDKEEALLYLEEELSFYEVAYAYDRALATPEYFEMPSISEEEIKRYESIKDDFSYMYERIKIVEELHSYYTNINNYRDYLSSIERNVDTLSHSPMWMMMSEVEKEDIYAHAFSYEKLKGIEIKPISYLSVKHYSNSMIGRLMSFILVCVIAVLIIKEDEESMSELLLSTQKGHKKTTLAKICSFLVVGFVVVMLVQMVDLFMHLLLYGGIDVSAPIQSMPSLYESPLRMNIGVWVCVSMIIFALCIAVLSVLFLFLYHICKSKILSFVAFFAFFVIEAIFYTVIPENSYFVPLSHVNILRLFEGCMVGRFLSYQHLLFIRIPSYVSIPLFTIVIGILFAVLYVYFYNHKIGKKWEGIKSITIKSSSLFVQESNRVLQLNKGMIIVLTVMIATICIYINKWNESKDIYQREKNIYTIYENYEGELNEGVADEITAIIDTLNKEEETYLLAKESYKKEELSYDELMSAKARYEEATQNKSYYNELYEFVLMGREHIVYNKGFKSVFGLMNPDKDLSRSALVMIALLLFISAMSYQKEEEKLYITTYNGVEKRRNALMALIFVVITGLFIYVEVVDYLYLTKLYPIGDYSVSLQLLFELDNMIVPAHLSELSSLQYLLCLVGIRLFALFSLYSIATCIFRISKNRLVGLLLCSLLFFMPMFLYYNGFTFMIHVSIFDMFMGNLFLLDTFSILRFLVIIVIDVLCGYFTIKQFKEMKEHF